jgi:hypothetical protein
VGALTRARDAIREAKTPDAREAALDEYHQVVRAAVLAEVDAELEEVAQCCEESESARVAIRLTQKLISQLSQLAE